MSKRTQKAGTAGRFGARYGVVVRNRVKSIEAHQKMKHECPTCHHASVTRVSAGIWECRHCGYKFAAEAYSPRVKKTTGVVKGAAAPVEALEE
ncbi:LSU ribosomal protein L37AE [Thermoplasmatales archaeon BRNA1]|nr:LSU ribosomal protein L37AE [Thermoplasmatales archaeon BRNA1]